MPSLLPHSPSKKKKEKNKENKEYNVRDFYPQRILILSDLSYTHLHFTSNDLLKKLLPHTRHKSKCNKNNHSLSKYFSQKFWILIKEVFCLTFLELPKISSFYLHLRGRRGIRNQIMQFEGCEWVLNMLRMFMYLE